MKANWIDEMEALAKAATPGPWEHQWIDGSAPGMEDQDVEVVDVQGLRVCMIEGACEPADVNDAAYIAAWSPDRVLKVLAVLRAAKALLQGYDAAIGGHDDDEKDLRAAFKALESEVKP